MEIKMLLVKAANKNGGDRYEGHHGESDVIFYIPQSISRIEGKPSKELIVKIERS